MRYPYTTYTQDELRRIIPDILELHATIVGKARIVDIDMRYPYTTYTQDELRRIIPDILELHATVVGKARIVELSANSVNKGEEYGILDPVSSPGTKNVGLSGAVVPSLDDGLIVLK